MNIRLKLTLQFLFTVALLLLGVLSVNYFFAVKYADDSFFERLAVRSEITLDNFISKGKASTLGAPVGTRFRASLAKEQFLIYDQNLRLLFNSDTAQQIAHPAQSQLSKVWQKKEYFKKNGKHYYAALVIESEGSPYLVLSSAVDEVGNMKLQNQLLVMSISAFLSLIFIYFMGRYFAKKALQPIGRVVQEVNQITASNLSMRVHEGNGTDEIARLAQTFNKMLARLEEAFKMQSNFVSNASHELRNPITSIIGNADVALDKERSVEEYRAILRSIYIEAERLNEIINNLLSLTQSVGNFGVKTNFTEVRVDELIMDLIEELALKKQNNRITVSYDEGDNQEFLINGNPALLQMAFNNLIDNACKYSGEKPVNILLKADRAHIYVNIIDQGIGIDQDELRYIFEPFYRSHYARQFKGFGIGLTIVKKVVELHEAELVISSTPEIGTTVSVIFKQAHLNTHISKP